MAKYTPVRRRRPRSLAPLSREEMMRLPTSADDPPEAWDAYAAEMTRRGADPSVTGEQWHQRYIATTDERDACARRIVDEVIWEEKVDELVDEIIATERGTKNPMAHRRKNPHRRRNASLAWFKTRKGAITLGATTAALTVGALWWLQWRNIRRFLPEGYNRPPIEDATVTGPSGDVVTDPASTTGGNKPKSISTASLPAELLAGGAPLEPGWKTVGWYTYPEGQIWIRIDEYEDALFKEGDTTFTQHTGKIIGRWRWVVIAGQATPMASGELNGTYDLSRNVIYNEYDRTSAEDTMYWAAAMQAMRWIDTAYGLK